MCQGCCRVKNWQDVVDQNHLHESINGLWELVRKYKPNDGIDPDNIRGVFLTYLNRGTDIPQALEMIKSQYGLYPPVDPAEEEDKP